ncbi:MAG: hypothetical protein AVDCRST_MAG88-3034 [uncultured Thermomicrobiales bacterium]|uniref:Uncharacterized protein n=1 Tax=uncultured Thermomicrobiales bacterium TaxID=1645740 RepID=A0A6J4VIF4_9BACT|nr:MAG: hypothetical protein AVDCRST_MAG88-3034 [uncultured Thermomicrobiales bacterium]
MGRALLKSAPAGVVRGERGYRVKGVAWGAPIERVEARIDGGAWRPTHLVLEARGGLRHLERPGWPRRPHGDGESIQRGEEYA